MTLNRDQIDRAIVAAGFPLPPTVCPMPDYGLHVLRYILSTDLEVYGLLDDSALLAADHAGRIAVCSPEILPIAVDRISVVRMRILGILARRQQQPSSSPQQLQPVSAAQQPSSSSGGGARIPAAPKPVQPSSPAMMRF